MKTRQLHGNAGFTLPEILISLAVILFLGTVTTMAYQKLLDNAREAVCTTNVKALTTAVEAYAVANEALPAVLGDLEPRHVQKAYAQVREKSSLWIKLARHLVDLKTSNIAYADFFRYDKLKDYGASAKMFVCPNNKDGGISYGINANVAGMKWDDIEDDVLLIADCDSPTFTGEGQLKKRHQSGTLAIGSTKGKHIAKDKTPRKVKNDKDKDDKDKDDSEPTASTDTDDDDSDDDKDDKDKDKDKDK